MTDRELIITTRDDLRRYVSDAIGSEGTDALIDAVAEHLAAQAYYKCLTWGDDWFCLLEMSEDEWNAMLDRYAFIFAPRRDPPPAMTDLDDDEDRQRLTE